MKLGPQDARVQLSAEDFANADLKPPYGYERVKSKLDVLCPSGPEHRKMTRPFRRALGGYWGLHRSVIDDIHTNAWVATSPDNDRIPDIAVYLIGPPTDQVIPYRIPNIIYEFVSADRSDQERDYINKRAEYHSIGVEEYVIIDRFKEQVLVLTWQPGDYAERVLTSQDEYTTRLLPGLKVSLKEVFE